jgi:transcriptional regulator with XRE-family HTH domain
MTEAAFLKKLAGRIKELRESKGMSQQELAAKLDYEKSNMSRLESGLINPRIATLQKVAKALDVALPELLTFK